MDSRTAAHVLNRIAALLELAGENRFKARAYEGAAAALREIDTDDLGPLVRSGAVAELSGIGPATLGVIRELCETGESSYLERLRDRVPEGLLELLRLPRLGAAKIHTLHEELGVRSLDDLEQAARSGRLAEVKGFGPKTVDHIVRSITELREAGTRTLIIRALPEARRLLASVRGHPDVIRAEVAGSVRRHVETVTDVDIVAGCRGDPARVCASFANAPGVKHVANRPQGASISFVDGTCLDIRCVSDDEFAIALWRATGSGAHVREVESLANAAGMTLHQHRLLDARGVRLAVADEPELYAALGIPWIDPGLRETGDEVAAAVARQLPEALEPDHIRGCLHCHTRYSDGRASVREMADAARERGWSWLGIADHSQAAFYAGGLKRDQVLAQHDEIDRVNADFAGSLRVLKGIEADILQDGRLDYDEELRSRFDFVVGSVHSRFAQDATAMTQRVLRALDDPTLTVLAHPTGRLLLSRKPYAIDLDAVLEKAAERGVAVELNSDPYRLDLDWRYLRGARDRGAMVSIGPDAHSTRSLDNVFLGVVFARKGWLGPRDLLNTRDVQGVLDFARKKQGTLAAKH